MRLLWVSVIAATLLLPVALGINEDREDDANNEADGGDFLEEDDKNRTEIFKGSFEETTTEGFEEGFGENGTEGSFGSTQILTRNSDLNLSYEVAVELAALPLKCYNQEYPHKFSHVYNSSADLVSPSTLHPIFYGCFDWHSAVHGHWLLAAVANRFPGTELDRNISAVFDQQFTPEKVATELELFEDVYNKIFERTYGWAWLLKLYNELQKSPLDKEKGWSKALKPLADKLADAYILFLKALVYPLRIGEHGNTAFGLVFPLEHADASNNTLLAKQIRFNATSLYSKDTQCPIAWEPSGFDFLSPCLQEADLMSRVMNGPDFVRWFKKFLPELFSEKFRLEPGRVIDRTDGTLVHLDGLNFSRAWNLYSLITKLSKNDDKVRKRLFALGDDHIRASIDYVRNSHYSGGHWLASFLLRALELRDLALRSMKM